jgi:hypothetical protein
MAKLSTGTKTIERADRVIVVFGFDDRDGEILVIEDVVLPTSTLACCGPCSPKMSVTTPTRGNGIPCIRCHYPLHHDPISLKLNYCSTR